MAITSGPLNGITVIELAGIGPGPYAGQLLADMGADVVVIDRPGNAVVPKAIDGRGKRSIMLDLKNPDAVAVLLTLVAKADVLIEGLRPGVTERMGIGPEACHAVNPQLIYGRMTGWGQSGPWSKMAGHDLNYIGMTGALYAMGAPDAPPAPPLNLVGDFGGGSMFLVNGILAALVQRATSGNGTVVDAAIIDGTHSLMSFIHGMAGAGQWNADRQNNLLDGAAPFYRCYATSDGKYMAVGCIEPQFFALMLQLLEIDPQDFGSQHDRAHWPEQHRTLTAIFAQHPRDHWEAMFALTDACITPVLTYAEAADHPANLDRQALVTDSQWCHPQIAPRLASHPLQKAFAIPEKGADYRLVLRNAGYDETAIAALKNNGALIPN